MSLVQDAVAAAISENESKAARKRSAIQKKHDSLKSRYVELLISSENTPESRKELAEILRELATADPPITASDAARDAAAIEEGRRLMTLRDDAQRADDSRQHEASACRVASHFSLLWERERQVALSNALSHYSRCRQHTRELSLLAKQHPEFFETRDGVPCVIGFDPSDDLHALRVDMLQSSIQRCDDAIREAERTISHTLKEPADRQAALELWRGNRQAERQRLVDQLTELGADVDDPSQTE